MTNPSSKFSDATNFFLLFASKQNNSALNKFFFRVPRLFFSLFVCLFVLPKIQVNLLDQCENKWKQPNDRIDQHFLLHPFRWRVFACLKDSVLAEKSVIFHSIAIFSFLHKISLSIIISSTTSPTKKYLGPIFSFLFFYSAMVFLILGE